MTTRQTRHLAAAFGLAAVREAERRAPDPDRAAKRATVAAGFGRLALYGGKRLAVLPVADSEAGEPAIVGDGIDFLDANQDDDQILDVLCTMPRGSDVAFGGGASPEWIIRRTR